MNLKVLLLSMSFFMIFISCSKEDDAVALSADTIAGTWKLASITCDDGQLFQEYLGEKVSATYKVSSKDHNATVIFGENPNTFKTMGSYTGITATNYNGVIDTQELPFTDFSNSGTWKIENNKLIVTNDDGLSDEYQVVQLDAKSFTYKYILDLEINDFDIIQSFKATYVVTLKR